MFHVYHFSYRCHQQGHIARDCNKPIQCYRCNGFGHIARDCAILSECHICNQIDCCQSNLNIEIRKGYLTHQEVRQTLH